MCFCILKKKVCLKVFQNIKFVGYGLEWWPNVSLEIQNEDTNEVILGKVQWLPFVDLGFMALLLLSDLHTPFCARPPQGSFMYNVQFV